jgi:hypothetical protein
METWNEAASVAIALILKLLNANHNRIMSRESSGGQQ